MQKAKHVCANTILSVSDNSVELSSREKSVMISPNPFDFPLILYDMIGSGSTNGSIKIDENFLKLLSKAFLQIYGITLRLGESLTFSIASGD